MLLFSTLLDINEKMNREKFFDLILEWNETQYYKENRIPDLKWNGEYGTKLGSEDLWICFEEYKSIVAVRYEKRNDDGVIWDTDYVMNFRNMKMVIRLERSYTEEALAIDGKFSSPYFISLLIDKGYLKKDKDLVLQRGATGITKDNLSLLTDVVNGEITYKLPVVYVSKNLQNEDPVDVVAMSKKLRGMAHVLVQEDLSTNKDIQTACDSKNEYRGSIGLYFPNAKAGHKTLRYRRETGADPMLMDKVIQLILQYANSQMIDPLFTWQGVNNALLLERLNNQTDIKTRYEEFYKEAEEKLSKIQETLDEESSRIAAEARAQALSEANELLESFDEEEKQLRKQIEDLTKANEALRIENDGLRLKFQSMDGVPLLKRGEEDDFYEGEIKDLVLLVLNEALTAIPENTRRNDAVRDIIDNNDFKHLTEKRTEEIKRMLKTYTGMSAKLRQDLESLDFEITEDGKHYKVYYHGDPRYCCTMSKTPSDWRAGKSIVSEITNLAL